MSIKESFLNILSEIPEDVVIVPASKTRGVDEILEVISAGARDIGENYIQEAKRKKEEINELKPDSPEIEQLRWHLIGRLQKSNINKALKVFDVIQSVDSLKLAKEINKRVLNSGKEKQEIFLQINIGEEEQKAGFMPELAKLKDVCIEINSLENLQLNGLMCIEPYTQDDAEREKYFREMKRLFDELNLLEKTNLEYLSMGMSKTYGQAIKCGSNMIRPGTKIFGSRKGIG